MKIVLTILAYLFASAVVAGVATLIDGHLTTLQTMITGGITFILTNAFIEAAQTTLYPENTP